MIHVPAPARAALLLSSLLVCAPASAQTAYRVRDIATGTEGVSLGISGMGAAAGAVYFGTYSQDRAYAQLWRTDGTAAGTHPVRDFGPDATDAPTMFTPVPFGAYFFASRSIWKIDASGIPTKIRDLGRTPTSPPIAVGNTIVFVLDSGGDAGGELWATDGTSVERLSTSIPGGELFEPVVLGDAMIYLASDDAHGLELWRSDGTPSGTRLLADLNPGSEWSSINRLARFGDRVYFAGYDGSRWGLWSNDGTSGAPSLVREFAAPFGYDIVAAGDYLYFTSDGAKLWRSDGTEQGTVRLAVMDWIQGLTAVGRTVFFQQGGGEQGGILWTSDGSFGGTHAVSGFLRVGLPNSSSTSVASIAGRLLFSASDGVHGFEPWVSDGTAERTRMLADIAPGLPSSGPQSFSLAGGLAYFSANDGATGRELWAIPVEALASEERAPVSVGRPPGTTRALEPRP